MFILIVKGQAKYSSSGTNDSAAKGVRDEATAPGKGTVKGWIYILPLAFAAAVLVFALYSKVLNAPFQFDDIANIRDNAFIRITDVSLKSLMDAGFKSNAANRPVANISFALGYLFHAESVAGFRIVNIVMHLITGLFLMLFVRDTLRLSRERSLSGLVPMTGSIEALAFAVALVWLVHPLHTQSVTYIVQRMNSMSAMFYMISLVCYVRGRLALVAPIKPFLYGLSFLSALLAMGSKEIAVTLPFFMLLYEWYFFRDLDTAWIKRHLPIIASALVIAIVLAFFYLRGVPLEAFRQIYRETGLTPFQRVLTELRIVVMYAGLIFLPHPSRLNLDYDMAISHSLIDPATTLVSLVLIAGLTGLALAAAKKDRIISFAILWFFGNLALESSIIPLELVYEHRTYLPSMSVILLAVLFAHKFLKNAYAQAGLLVVVTIALSLWTYQRNLVWQDEISLWKDCAEKSPNKARTHNNYGLALLAKGRVDEAIAQCRRAVDLGPNIPNLHINLGKAIEKKGDLDGAASETRKALMLDPNSIESQQRMAQILEKKGSLEETLKHYEEILRKDPHNIQALNGMGKVTASKGDYEKSMQYFSRSLNLDPDSAETYNSIGNVFLMQGRLEDSKRQYLNAIQKNPRYFEAYYNLGMAFIRQGRTTEGITYLGKAVSLGPDFEKAHSGLASAYLGISSLDKAVTELREVLRINPANSDAAKNLKSIMALSSKLDTVIKEIQAAVAKEPGNAALHARLGDLLRRRGNLESAMAEFRKSLEIKPSPEALHGLALIHSQRGEYEMALENIVKIREMKPEDPEVYYNLACIYSKQGRTDPAINSLKMAKDRGFRKWDMMKADPDLENVRNNEAFRKILPR